MRKTRTAGATTNGIRALSDEELGGVAGGMKWTRGTKNSDVVDARGGQISILWVTITFDKSGNVSSVTQK